MKGIFNMTATASEFLHFENAKRERERKYRMTKLILESDAPEQPAEETLLDRVERKQLHDLSKFTHHTFGSTRHNGKRVGLQLSWQV
jgi:hypothetical protein